MRALTRVVLVTLLVAVFPVYAMAQEADPADVESIDAIMAAVYDVISGGAGEARDWDRWHSLFAEGATLSAVVGGRGGTARRVTMTPESYVEQNGAALEQGGFFETEIGRVTERFGLIAHAFSAYESKRSVSDAEPFARGINSFQLMSDGDRWWVVSIFWQSEGPNNPIPARYIGNR